MTSQVTLQITVDPSGAVSGTGQVTTSVRNMTSSVNSNLSSIQRSFRQLDSFVQRATGSISGFMKALAATAAVDHLLDRLIEVNMLYTQFTATLGAVKGSAGLAAEEFEYLLRASNQMGVNVESSIKNYTRLASSMKHLDETGESTRHVFEGVSQAASVLHLKGYEANGILIAFEQILSKNKLSLEEVQRQLSNRMPDAMGTAARSMSMTQPEFRKAITEGTIHPLEFVLRLANQLKQEYGEAAKVTADSFIGQQARMHNAVLNLYRTVGQSGAMEGLTKILKAVTGMLDDPNIGAAFGESLNEVFSSIAKWISTITASDIHDFFDGLSGVVKSLVTIMRELVKSFADTVDGEPDFISFAQAVTNGLLTMIEVTHTLVSGLLAIPAAIRAASSGMELLKATFSSDAVGFGKQGEVKTNAGEREKLRKQYEEDQKALGNLMDKFVFKGTLDSARTQTNQVFDNLKKQRELRNSSQTFPLSYRPQDIGTMSEDKIQEKKRAVPGPESNAKKGLRDVFNTESVRLAKDAATSMLEYNNIMNNQLDIENRNITQLEIKFRYDKDFIKLSSQKKDILRQLAREADDARVKEQSARAFQEDRLSLNRSIYKSEQDIIDVSEYRNVTETRAQRELEEKLKFDVKYKHFTEEMIQTELAMAKALDEKAVKLENMRKVEESRYSTRLNQLQTERDIAQMQSGVNPSRYNEANNVIDSFRKGGSNFNLDADTKLRMLEDAKNRDYNNKRKDAESLGLTIRDEIQQMQLENELIGRSTFEIQKATEAKKIFDYFKQNGIDLTKSENAEWLKYAQVLSNDVWGAIDKVQEKQKSWQAGMSSGIATYLDEVNNVLKNTEQATVKIFKSMEDTLVDFITTGEFNFRDFATMVIKEMVRIMVQITIMKPLMEAISGFFGGGGGMFGFDLFKSAKGNAFDANGPIRKFAKGGAFTNKIVDSPTNFMLGQMGERGPEAIMPLMRDSSGRLGIASSGESGGIRDVIVNVTVNSSGDVQESKSNDSSNASVLAEKMRAAALQVVHEELRPGGVLSGARR